MLQSDLTLANRADFELYNTGVHAILYLFFKAKSLALKYVAAQERLDPNARPWFPS